MSNSNRPSGLSPVRYLNGAPWNGGGNVYSIAASYGTDLYIGDPVISSGTADTNGVPGIAIAAGSTTSSGALRGVIVGLGKSSASLVDPDNLSRIYRPASDPSVWYALVVDDPNVLFEVQERSSGTALAATEVGRNTVLYVGTGNGYVSGWQLASATDATPNTTNTLQVKLFGLAQYPAGTNAFGAYAKWLVQINVHELGHGLGSAGV